MSYLSAQGQINSTSFQVSVDAGGGLTTVPDTLYTTGAFSFESGFYLISFTTTIGGAIATGYLEFQKGGVDFGQIQLFGPGTYTLTAPVFLSGATPVTVVASGTGATWTSSQSVLYFNRLP
jgi:hypothetical protein